MHAAPATALRPMLTRLRRVLGARMVWIFLAVLLGAVPGVPALAQQDAPPLPQGPLTQAQLVAAVLRRNPSLASERAALTGAAARIKTAGRLPDPMLSVGVAPGTIGNAVGAREDVEVSQAFPWWGTLDAETAVARLKADAASEDVHSLALKLSALAESAYAEWWYVHAALEINRRHQALYAQLREAAKARFAAGLAPEQDVLQADVERTMLRQEALGLRQQQLAVQAAIDALLNLPGDASLPVPGPLPATNALPPLRALTTFALGQHPSLRALELQEREAHEQETLAKKARFPNFSVSAGYNSMWDNAAMRPMIGVSINVPLDQGKRRAEIDAARAGARQAAQLLTALSADLGGKVAAAYAAVDEEQQSVRLYRDQLVPLAQATLAVSRSEYASGQSSFLYLIDAERRWLDAELGLARSQAALDKGLAELGQRVGTSLPIELPRAGDTPAPAQAPGLP